MTTDTDIRHHVTAALQAGVGAEDFDINGIVAKHDTTGSIRIVGDEARDIAQHVPAEPNPTPWESLIQQARWIAALAEQYATLGSRELLPADGDEHNPLDELDERAMHLRAMVAAARRATYQELLVDGMTQAEIARAWGITPQAVHKALNPR